MRKHFTWDSASRLGVASLCLYVLYLTVLVSQCVRLDDNGQPVADAVTVEPWAYLLLGAFCLTAVVGSLFWRSFRRRNRLEATLKELWLRRNAGDHAGADEMLARYKQIAGES